MQVVEQNHFTAEIAEIAEIFLDFLRVLCGLCGKNFGKEPFENALMYIIPVVHIVTGTGIIHKVDVFHELYRKMLLITNIIVVTI